MDKPIKNLDAKTLFSKLGKNTAWLFFAAFLVLCIFDAKEIKNSVLIILAANVVPAAPTPAHSIKVDFTGYNRVLEIKREAENFYPTTTPTSSPFGTGQ